jgi:hypothetical protein
VAGTRLLSDVPETLTIDVGKPARVIDAALKKYLKQVRALYEAGKRSVMLVQSKCRYTCSSVEWVVPVGWKLTVAAAVRCA